MTKIFRSGLPTRFQFAAGLGVVWLSLFAWAVRLVAQETVVLDMWPDKPPGETRELPPEADQTKPDGRLIAGCPVIRLGNVSTPQIAVYRPHAEKETGAAVLICPGGGHHILAYDLEGTEVAHWLNSIGVTGIVLKYRVPFRDPERRWLAGVQDAQRAMSLIRSHAAKWNLDPDRIGICGFSAGGEVAARTALLADQKQYPSVDDADDVSSRPDFALLIYPAYLVNRDQTGLRSDLPQTDGAPPMFFVHAFDDGVSVQNTLLLASELKRTGGSAALCIFASGGHGYGLRRTEQAVTRWPDAAFEWLREQKILNGKSPKSE
ncbi:MAG: alpha/beta hydrolase [Planctomycetaceae bacterium]|nr:MAG: alpha/beta hydrolase [Planctomycetaceae bacterium]